MMITVVGSINMDLAVEMEIFPKQGETVQGTLFKTIPGGKGANQAVAAARLGSRVRFIGAVGNDSFGKELYENLIKEKVDVSGIAMTENSTGIANILLHNRDNRIIVIPGANYDVSKEMIDENIHHITGSKLVMMQLEIPVETVEHVLSICRKQNIPVLLNPAPAKNFKKDWMQEITYLTPNETECERIFGADWESVLKEYPKKVIVTLGSAGAAFHDGNNIVRIPGHQTNAVDTTGAGDAFNGAFAHAICSGKSIDEAVRFANVAASLSVEKFGAQGGMPTLDEVMSRLGGKER